MYSKVNQSLLPNQLLIGGETVSEFIGVMNALNYHFVNITKAINKDSFNTKSCKKIKVNLVDWLSNLFCEIKHIDLNNSVQIIRE